ncbi:NAD-dependent epimerase/dehydratase family protein [Nocardiopsis exhalans]|uniref:NAD-dependent epimerase/dehydratase family protein n=1 Tax=Nocardiopsis exhalans TaxID=163604 RepID=A0ABY5D4A7_9ACTN|nr:NAD-dependent epimerase/dehydratase family protein [Nocardiopsis exhalans]USY17690.1 NAD-dependent epimerase/dehydratase family protein [Nocardiopsis exhalans]
MADIHTLPLGDRERALVTGATGLLGSNIVRLLLDRGQEVVAFVRDLDRARTLLPADEPRLRLVQGDITAPASYRGVLHEVDEVFHTAAYFREYFQDPSLTGPLEAVNVRATGDLLRASAEAGVPVFVHTSSINTLALRGAGHPADETTPAPDRFLRLSESECYPSSKVRAERVVDDLVAAGNTGATRSVVVLPGWMWGPGDAGPTSAGRLFLDVARGSVRAVPRLSNYVVDARDVARACVAAARVGRHSRYVVAGSKVPLPELTGAVAARTGGRQPRPVPAGLAMAAAGLMELQAKLSGTEPTATRTAVGVLREGDRRHISSKLAERDLGVGPRPVEDTIGAMASWYREHGMLAGVEKAGRATTG